MRSENHNESLEDLKDEPNKDYNSELSISEDELKHDKIRVKEKKKKNKTMKKNDKLEFEEIEMDINSNESFYQMNLSRPLLKAVADLKFVHPTPIQAATIPVALLGKYDKVAIFIIKNL